MRSPPTILISLLLLGAMPSCRTCPPPKALPPILVERAPPPCLITPPPAWTPVRGVTPAEGPCHAPFALCLYPDELIADAENVRAARGWMREAWERCGPRAPASQPTADP